MNINILWYTLWLATVAAGVIIKNFVPEEFVYTTGFIAGCTSLFFLFLTRN